MGFCYVISALFVLQLKHNLLLFMYYMVTIMILVNWTAVAHSLIKINRSYAQPLHLSTPTCSYISVRFKWGKPHDAK